MLSVILGYIMLFVNLVCEIDLYIYHVMFVIVRSNVMDVECYVCCVFL